MVTVKKVIRIASVEQLELGNIMELSVTGHVLKWAGETNVSGRASLSKADGWNLEESLLPGTCVKRLSPA